MGRSVASVLLYREAMNFEPIQQFLTTTAVDVGLKVLAAVAFALVGRWVVGKLGVVLQRALTRSKVDPTLSKYLGSMVTVALNVALGIGILGYFGIQTTSFAALLAGAGMAVGAAWGGLLGNFAAGAFMLVLRPFRVGDFVTAGGITGTVHELGLFGTSFVTADNVLTVVGNGKIFSDTIANYSALPLRRVDRTVQLAHGVDVADALERFKRAVSGIDNVSKVAAPEVNLLELKLEGPVIAVRSYAHNDHYWQVFFDMNLAVLRECQAAGWPTPAPHHVTRLEGPRGPALQLPVPGA